MVMAIMAWYVGFSDGTEESAESEIAREGGGCSREPPLRLTINVVPSKLLLRFQVSK